ncbi:MAG: tetratricopeptide repeat protein [Pyrinomonadaceae bacterium]|nr:tetratricopeptide repeat protein [Pyrinomonadaceae bacterium]
MMKRALIVLSLTVALFGAVVPLQSVRGILMSPEELAAVNSSTSSATARNRQGSTGNSFVRAFKAPFKAIGRLFGRGKKVENKLERLTDKDIRRFESTPVDQIKDATVAQANTSGNPPDRPAASAVGHLEKGRHLLSARHLNEAIAELSLATSTDPSLSEAHNLLGVAYQFKGLPDMARRSFEAALKIDKNNLQTLNNLGYLLSSTGDYKGALSFLKKAARLAPDDPRVLNNLALAQSQLGKFDEAPKNFVRAGGEIKGRLNAANQLQIAGRPEEAQKQFEAAKLRAEAEQKADAGFQAITVLVELKNGRVTYASVSNHRPGLEAYEASALRFARQRRFPIDKNGQESVVVKVSPPPAS